MKKFLFILTIVLSSLTVVAQKDQPGKIQERMKEYIQNRLSLSKAEAERFTPVFMRYLKEFGETHRQNKEQNNGDRLVLQQKIIELRLRYRGEFKQIMDDQRANQVYKHEDDFRREVIQIIKENRLENRPTKRNQRMLN
jgi:hypothetical protein